MYLETCYVTMHNKNYMSKFIKTNGRNIKYEVKPPLWYTQAISRSQLLTIPHLPTP